MGLFNRSKIPNEIYSYTEVVLDDVSKNFDLFDCDDDNFSVDNAIKFIGFFSYYIAGTTKSKYAQNLINLFCDNYILPKDKATVEELIQKCYSIARNASDTLMSSGENLGSIIAVHSELLCDLNNWKITDNNKNLLSIVLENYYAYLLEKK